MLDHELEEQPIEGVAASVGEASHLFGGEHARHQRRAGRVVRVRARDLLSAGLQPPLHHLDFVRLRHLDALGEQPHVVAAGALRQQGRHLERLRVVADHTLHEPDVGGRELDPREIAGFLGGNRARRLSGGARLDDGRTAADLGRAARGAEERQDKKQCGGCRALHQVVGVALLGYIPDWPAQPA